MVSKIVTLHLSCFPATLAVMVAFPGFIPLTLPLEDTLAILLSEELHFTLSEVPVTFSVWVSPIQNDRRVLLSFTAAFAFVLFANTEKLSVRVKISARKKNLFLLRFLSIRGSSIPDKNEKLSTRVIRLLTISIHERCGIIKQFRQGAR